MRAYRSNWLNLYPADVSRIFWDGAWRAWPRTTSRPSKEILRSSDVDTAQKVRIRRSTFPLDSSMASTVDNKADANVISRRMAAEIAIDVPALAEIVRQGITNSICSGDKL